ncbi:MAG: hypothetical protein HN739_14580 [Gammaproteobacteria bacterium]|nr:hypothetical protein [Acidiferrobacteraceae bacterium]MBT4894230.1 hypothetical protein [Gammaproteobacteria bacterium]MBT4395352.1 hypothetical protein [Acidiferrobacteraceae bacterium]MBT4404706.1 hypothetical protein [Acidiferrobacteraceae bacterium]MBT5623802.1 hypothetical protein [Acidiferrobacteraceae bacterium]
MEKEPSVNESENKSVVERIQRLEKTTKIMLGLAVGAVAISVVGAALLPLKLKVALPKLGIKVLS